MNIPTGRVFTLQATSYSYSFYKLYFHLSLGEEALTPLLHLGPQHLAPAALVRIRHLLSGVTDAVLTLRMKVV